VALIELGTLRDYWKKVYDWITATDAVSSPKVTVSTALPSGTNNIGDVDVLSCALPTGASTEATLLSIKDTSGIKKITDALPTGTNVLGKTGIQVADADVSAVNPVPTSIVGSLANNQTNKVTLANTNILAVNYTSTAYSKSILQVMTNTAGVLSLVVDGVSGTLNSGLALVANAWYEFDISLLSGSTYNLQLSVGATMQVKWQVI